MEKKWNMPNQSSTKVSKMGWIICGLGTIFFGYEYLLRITPSVIAEPLMEFYNIDATAFGTLSAFYYFAYTPMQIPVGLLMDRYGPRRLLTFACLCCVIGVFMFSTQNLPVVKAGRFLVGFGSAFGLVGSLKLGTLWLPPQYFAVFTGVTISVGMLGATLGEVGLTAIMHHVGWHNMIVYSALIGIVLCFILFFVIQDSPVEKPKQAKEGIQFSKAFTGFWKLVFNSQIWINGLIGSLAILALSTFAELWANPYLQKTYHFTESYAAWAVSMFFMGYAFGAPLFGWISDRSNSRRLPVRIGLLCSCISISIILYVPHLPDWTILLLLFLLGTTTASKILGFVIAREISDAKNLKNAATAIAITNMQVMISPALFQPLIGYFLDLVWEGQMHGAVRDYSPHDYKIALSVLPLAFILAVTLTFFLKETYGTAKQVK